MGDGLGPGYRLIEARQRIKRAMLAIDLAILNTSLTTCFAGSDAARDGYAELTEAARELVAAQDAFDAYCRERAIGRKPVPAAGLTCRTMAP